MRWCPSLRDVRALVLAAMADGHVDRAALQDEVDAGSLAGSAHLRRSLQDWDRGARSAPEAEAVDVLLEHSGLPFLVNPSVVLDGVLLGSPDGWLPAAGLGWEIDSRQYHGGTDDLDATLRRHQGFADADLVLLHVTPTRLRADRRAWALDVARRAGARIAEGWQPPDGLVVTPLAPALVPAIAA